MQIYSIDAHYPGPFCSYPDDDPESIAAQRANRRAETLLEAAIVAAGFKCFHQYSWPDGSLYKWAVLRGSGTSTARELNNTLNSMLNRFGIDVGVKVEAPDRKPYKCNYETLGEYVANSKNGI